ncbi:unnamed protein product [Heligmosomoides polygyrus]|uniref:RRM domain-containing protein n=1 Tax=Heligmosomoides polygyrus TaxID=6339 RepID=A0A183GSB6_HELPZ|nr:unnamed protein product [Heligmosomoides polygyrus]
MVSFLPRSSVRSVTVYGFASFQEDLQERALNDPNSHVFSQSTMVTFDGDGQPRVVENSIRKTGDVKETRRTLRDGEREEMAIGHTIGDRTHIIEKKRDKDGNVRRQQKFVNLDESQSSFGDSHYRSFSFLSMLLFSGRRALGDGSSYGGGYRHHSADAAGGSRSSAPIITLPDDDDDEDEQR